MLNQITILATPVLCWPLVSHIAEAQDAYRPATLQLPPASDPYPDTLNTHLFHRLVSQSNPASLSATVLRSK